MLFRFALMLVLCAVFSAAPSRAATIGGHAYTRVSDWAAVNGFRMVDDGRADLCTLTNRAAARLVFEKNSHTARINGVEVALSFAVALEKGVFYVAQQDFAKTVEPLVSMAKLPEKKISTVCIDPGHGGKDTGNITGSRTEKTVALSLANELASQLKAAGFKVVFTRTRDRFIELADRPEIANRAKADLFISLHFNATATSRSEVSGVETYCITPVGASSSNAEGRGAGSSAATGNRVERQSLVLAYQVHKNLVKTLAAEDRGVRRARFAVLRDAEMPAILVEAGYMTHPAEGKKVADSAYRKKIAASIVQGVVAYQKLVAPPEPKPAPAPTNKPAGTRPAPRR